MSAPSYEPETYWRDLLSRSFSLQGVGWPGLSLGFNEWQYRARRGAVRGLVRDARGLDVLDVGAGTGFWVAFWHGLGARSVAGIDLTDVSVERLRERFPGDRFARADVTDTVPLDGPFDLVSCMDVLLHVVEDEPFRRALANLRRVARPGGRLVLLEPVSHGSPAPFVAGAHSRARRLVDVEPALSEAGWVLETARPALWLLNAPTETAPRALVGTLRLSWRVVERLARDEATGRLVGAALYPIDRVLCRLGWGPTTKLLLARASP